MTKRTGRTVKTRVCTKHDCSKRNCKKFTPHYSTNEKSYYTCPLFYKE